MTSAASIETRDLTCRFGSHTALAPLTLTIPCGSVYALVGENGAGKSTLMKLLLNMVLPSAGSAIVAGVPSTQLTGEEFIRIGYVAEGQEMPECMTVRGYMDYLRPFYPRWNEGTLLRDLDLPEDRRISALSRGMRMKVAMASVLAFQPELVLLDEPFSGLDPFVRDELTGALLDRMSAGDEMQPTVLISSHDMGEIEAFATHVAMLQKGHLVLAEPMETLQARFRNVSVTLPVTAVRPTASMEDWLDLSYSGHVARFVHTRWSEEHPIKQIEGTFSGTSDIQADPMSLREVFIALTRTHANERRAA